MEHYLVSLYDTRQEVRRKWKVSTTLPGLALWYPASKGKVYSLWNTTWSHSMIPCEWAESTRLLSGMLPGLTLCHPANKQETCYRVSFHDTLKIRENCQACGTLPGLALWYPENKGKVCGTLPGLALRYPARKGGVTRWAMEGKNWSNSMLPSLHQY